MSAPETFSQEAAREMYEALTFYAERPNYMERSTTQARLQDGRDPITSLSWGGFQYEARPGNAVPRVIADWGGDIARAALAKARADQ